MAEAAPGGSPSPAQKSSSPPEKSPSSATQKAPGPAAAGGPAKPTLPIDLAMDRLAQ